MQPVAEAATEAISEEDLRRKVLGCWLGKAVGGTLGQQFEGNGGVLDADFYHPVPEEMVPNDDLDLQVVFACVLAEMDDPQVDPMVLAEAWRHHVRFPWNEYGIALRNLAEGLVPPQTGSFDNWFTCGEGAAIRSELWACLAPGHSQLAADYAERDACFDHAGDGIAAARFLAAAESAAFTTSDRGESLDAGLSVIDPNLELARAVTLTRQWCADDQLTWQQIRELIIEEFGCDDFTDVRPNTAFVVLGLLRGTDFADSICITNNCGLDTDSSTASVGALLGILDPAALPARWLAPIGRKLVLNAGIEGLDHPEDLDGFTDLVLDLRSRLAGRDPALLNHAEVIRPLDVEEAWYNTRRLNWSGRDLTGMPNEGFDEPEVRWSAAQLPGGWVRRAAADFVDDIWCLRYAVHLPAETDVRIMVNCTEDVRVWVDGAPILASQGSQYMFPAPHMPPVGQYWDGNLAGGAHALTVFVRRPRKDQTCELVVAVAERPSMQHIPWALRRPKKN